MLCLVRSTRYANKLGSTRRQRPSREAGSCIDPISVIGPATLVGLRYRRIVSPTVTAEAEVPSMRWPASRSTSIRSRSVTQRRPA